MERSYLRIYGSFKVFVGNLTHNYAYYWMLELNLLQKVS